MRGEGARLTADAGAMMLPRRWIILLSIIAAAGVSAEIPTSSFASYQFAVPIMEFCDIYNISWRYQPVEQRLILQHDGVIVSLVSGERIFLVNNQLYTAENAVFIANSVFYVPIDIMNRLLPLLFKNERDAALLSFIERGDRAYLSRNGVIVPAPRTVDTAPDAVSNKTARIIERSERFIIAQSAPPADTTIDVIIIDPGHGGRDPGAIGCGDIREKDLVLDAAMLLRDALTRALSPRTKVVLTRGDDSFLSLEDRSLYANNAVGIGTKEQKNGLFISVHANASFNRSSRGFEVYFVSAEESSEAARAVASFENSVAVDFERNRYTYTNYAEGIYYKMIIEQYQKESSMMSGFVEEEISQSVKDVVKRTKPVQSALFYVLKGVLMPAVLVEIGFITNPVEAKLLTSKEYQEQMMQAVAAGVVRYVRLFEKTKGFTQ